MNKKISPLKQKFNYTLSLPGSKSLSNRALILAALCKEESIIEGLLDSDDTKACREGLKNIKESYLLNRKSPLHPSLNRRFYINNPYPAHVSTENVIARSVLYASEAPQCKTRRGNPEKYLLSISGLPRRFITPLTLCNTAPRNDVLRGNTFPELFMQQHLFKEGCRGDFSLNIPPLIHCQDAGTVARFLLPICAALAGEYHFDASPRLRERPLKPLIDILKQQGVKFQFLAEQDQMPFIIQSTGLPGGKIFIDIHHSSQFLSGLCMAAPLTQSGMILETGKVIKDKPYVTMTLQLMEKFGVYHRYQNDFTVEIPPAEYKATNITIEPDASTASYFFAAAALTQSTIHIKNLTRESCQGDLKFLDVLEKMGCQINSYSSGISVTGPINLKSIGSINMSNFSDTFMTLAVLAPFLPTATTIHGIHHTRYQESDRINAIIDGLHCVGIRTESTENSLTIFPGNPVGNAIYSHHDHRIAMAFSILGLKIPSMIINDAQCVNKTCPLFFEYLEQLKGENNVK